MGRLWELLAECLPIAGMTVVTEPVKRYVWGELLRRPADVARFDDGGFDIGVRFGRRARAVNAPTDERQK